MIPKLQIAIDGLAGCGKSSLAKRISSHYGILNVPTGDIYRFIATTLSLHGIDPSAVTHQHLAMLDELLVNEGIIYVRNEPISEINNHFSFNTKVQDYSAIIAIREYVNQYIMSVAQDNAVVIEGRDIGSIVLPNAQLKYYLTASIEYRVKNWVKGQEISNGFVDEKLREKLYYETLHRDEVDLTRKIAPLVCTEDATVINVEDWSGVELFNKICDDIEKVLIKKKGAI